MKPTSFSVVDSERTWRPMIRLSIPVFLEETMFLAVAWTDWWLTSRFIEGNSAMAAMTVVGYLMWLVSNLFASIAIGSTAIVSRNVGAGNAAQARATANQAMMIGLVFAGALTLLFYWIGDSFVAMLRLKGEALEYGQHYFSILVPIIPAIMISQIAAACLRGAGDTMSGLFAKGVVVVVNVFVSTALVTGFWIFPKLGWTGIALGTAIGHGVGAIILGGMMVMGRANLHLRLRFMKPDWAIIRNLFRIGLPGGFDMFTIVGSQLIFVAIINELGRTAGAAHGLAVQIEALAWMPGIAFQVAAATMAGQYLGAKLPDRAMKSSLACLAACLVVMVFAGSMFFFFGQEITDFFTGTNANQVASELVGDAEREKAETSLVAAELLKIIAFALPFLGVVMAFSGVLRGAGDTTSSLIFSSIGFFVVRIPLAILLAWPEFGVNDEWKIRCFDLGVQGAWYAMAIDLFVRSLLISARFVHGGWKKIKI